MPRNVPLMAEPVPSVEVIRLVIDTSTGQTLRDQYAALLDQAARAEEASE